VRGSSKELPLILYFADDNFNAACAIQRYEVRKWEQVFSVLGNCSPSSTRRRDRSITRFTRPQVLDLLSDSSDDHVDEQQRDQAAACRSPEEVDNCDQNREGRTDTEAQERHRDHLKILYREQQ
jgi:hypothetical protein